MIFEGTKNQFFFGLELTRAGPAVPELNLTKQEKRWIGCCAVRYHIQKNIDHSKKK